MALETVVSEANIGGFARKERAWEIISDFARYPQIMENVDDVKILEKSATEGKSEWDITIEDAPLSWIEKDLYQHENYKVLFESIDGDFDLIKGSWSVSDSEKGGIKIKFSISYDLGIPVIEEVLGDILKEKMLTNIDSMLNAIKADLGPQATDERNSLRIKLHQYTTIHSGDKAYRVKIQDISRLGMKIKTHETFHSTAGSIRIGGTQIEVGEFVSSKNSKYSRLLFAHQLSEESLAACANSIIKSTSEKTHPVSQKQLISD